MPTPISPVPSDDLPTNAAHSDDVPSAGEPLPSAAIFSTPALTPEWRARLQQLIVTAAELLPMQGPISAFAFLNPLQAFEDRPFEEGLILGARLHRCQPFFPEEKYRERMIHGRIKQEDLLAEVRQELGDAAHETLSPGGTLLDLWMTMLKHPVRSVREHEMQWFLAETDALTKMRSETAPDVREEIRSATRDWILRDLARFRAAPSDGQLDFDSGWNPPSSGGAPPRAARSERKSRPPIVDLLDQFGAASIESWSPQTWEAVTLRVLYRACRQGVHSLPAAPRIPQPAERLRDLVLAATSRDSDVLVHEVLVRYCAAYTDQGMAQVPLPNRDAGFYRAFAALYGEEGSFTPPWMRDLARELARIDQAGMQPLDVIHESLVLLDIAPDHWDEFIAESLLALRGWAGMLWQMETRDDRVAIAAPPGTLIEFFAVRMILERLALTWIGRTELQHGGSLRELTARTRRLTRDRQREHVAGIDQRAFLVFELAQFMGWTPPRLFALSRSEWVELVGQIESITGLELRRIFHRAFERRMRTLALDAIVAHTRLPADPARTVTGVPRFQTCFCIDAREESFRRHQEELAPDTESYSFAGFFAVAMYYKGIADAHFAALCPIVVRPKHWVVEDPLLEYERTHQARSRARRALGAAMYQVHVDSRSFLGGTVLAAGLGMLASIPLVGRVLFPSMTGKLRRTFSRLIQPPRVTRLRLERHDHEPGPNGQGVGFTVDEMAGIGERVLRDIGLTRNFSRIVFFFGHGSFGLNNPHMSAYNCGACSGGAGGPNARALAAMLNDPRVRAILRNHGLEIPSDTIFVGGLHNTSEETLSYHDEDLIPPSHRAEFEAACRTLNEVCRRNAHERCRRFYSAPLRISLNHAMRHVQRRAQDLAQPRTEYGNATNAICFVGRRARIRGLFLDRRAFLHSYDAAQDDANSSILARILAPVVPVCTGINMQYFFSAVDSEGWACGSKLPHNIASLLGVMDGAASDLRSGLPMQGVEVHEPLRLLFIIEASPAALLKIMADNPAIGRILGNGWGQLAVLDPQSSRIQTYRNGHFEDYQPTTTDLPHAATSFDWYGGRRDHLMFAEIGRDHIDD